MADILPDSRRQRAPAGVNRGIMGTYIPVFCANCGADGGLVPEENMTFVFYLCNTCVATHGEIAGMMLMPDEVFYQKLADAQLEEYGHYLTVEEFERLDASSQLVRLIYDHVRGCA